MTCDAAYVRRALDGAPAHGHSHPADMAGWILEDGAFVCAGCWSRIHARGASTGCRIVPVWDHRPAGARCVGCEVTT